MLSAFGSSSSVSHTLTTGSMMKTISRYQYNIVQCGHEADADLHAARLQIFFNGNMFTTVLKVGKIFYLAQCQSKIGEVIGR